MDVRLSVLLNTVIILSWQTFRMSCITSWPWNIYKFPIASSGKIDAMLLPVLISGPLGPLHRVSCHRTDLKFGNRTKGLHAA